MAKQLNLLGNGQITPIALHTEMERSYLEYAMSVIVGRALPDVRDGLKPVHRRILYAMYELGLTPDRPYRKCARVVGDVLGKYHPHGDQSVYEALVRMVQNFSSRYPLLSGHGNFGSVDDDPPAAMRYTETRLSPIAFEALLNQISEATVNYTNNFDNSQQEPVVLPAQLPILLLNGCSGIAVGMATNIPPHNLNELVDGLIALIDKPDLPDEKLWQLIPAPDFPTGGEIINNNGIIDAYRHGKGIVTLRGVASIENINQPKKRSRSDAAIIITELPYQVNKAAWIEKIADLVNHGKIEGIADIRDESDRDGMRVVIELKRDIIPQQIISQLYHLSALQVSFGIIILALVNNKPCQLSLRELLEEFLRFREATLTRQYSYELEQGQKRLHILEGLLIALKHLDRVINILRNAPDGTTAKLSLQQELNITDSQGDSILAMPLRRLTGLEQEKLNTEYLELETRLTELNRLLNDRHELLKSLKKELRSLKHKFGDERRTRIISPSESSLIEQESTFIESEEIPQNAQLSTTQQGFIHWHNPDSKLSLASQKNQDFVLSSQPINNQEQLVIVTDIAKVYPLPIQHIPSVNKKPPVTTISLLPNSAQRDSKKAIAHFFLPTKLDDKQLILLTQQGKTKSLPLTELHSLTNRGLTLIKLKDDDQLKDVFLLNKEPEMLIATTGGRVLRLAINDTNFPIMGRNAQGNQILRLSTETIAASTLVSPHHQVLLTSELGYAKLIPVNSLKLVKTGELGVTAFHFTTKSDRLIGLNLITPTTKIILLTNQDHKISLDIKNLPSSSQNRTGELLTKLDKLEKIVSVFTVDN